MLRQLLLFTHNTQQHLACSILFVIISTKLMYSQQKWTDLSNIKDIISAATKSNVYLTHTMLKQFMW